MARLFPGLWSAFHSGRGWGRFYRGHHEAAIPDLEIAWRRERSPILVGGPLGQAYARVGRDDDALHVPEELAAAVRAGAKEIESEVGLKAAVDGLKVLASLLDKQQRTSEAQQVRILAKKVRDARA
jgi:hypothetical protein